MEYHFLKNKEKAYEAIIEMSKNNDYTTGNLLDYEYFPTHYRTIAIDLSKQTELENLDIEQQINFIGRLEEDATMFFIIDKKKKKPLLISHKIPQLLFDMYKIGNSKDCTSTE